MWWLHCNNVRFGHVRPFNHSDRIYLFPLNYGFFLNRGAQLVFNVLIIMFYPPTAISLLGPVWKKKHDRSFTYSCPGRAKQGNFGEMERNNKWRLFMFYWGLFIQASCASIGPPTILNIVLICHHVLYFKCGNKWNEMKLICGFLVAVTRST